MKIPPLTDIRGLIAASAEIEKSEENNMLPDRKWIAQLWLQPGTSLGGARPKANVIDTDKTLYVAKFPSRKDDYDAGLGNISALACYKSWDKCGDNKGADNRREIPYIALEAF